MLETILFNLMDQNYPIKIDLIQFHKEIIVYLGPNENIVIKIQKNINRIRFYLNTEYKNDGKFFQISRNDLIEFVKNNLPSIN